MSDDNGLLKVTKIDHASGERSSWHIDAQGDPVDRREQAYPAPVSDLASYTSYQDAKQVLLEAWEEYGRDVTQVMYAQWRLLNNLTLTQPGEATLTAYHVYRCRQIKPKRDYAGRRAASQAWLQERGLGDG